MSLFSQLEAEKLLRERLIASLRSRRGELSELLARVDDHWGMEDAVYRFYHQSFKVYHAQRMTLDIVQALQALLPERPLNPWFSKIIAEGTGKTFDMSHNDDWLKHTRPILEALFHARWLLAMACRYAEEFETMPQMLPSGFAGLLYLFDLR